VEIFANVFAILFVGAIISFIIYRDKKQNKWEEISRNEVDQERKRTENLTEAQKGNGRASGPF